MLRILVVDDERNITDAIYYLLLRQTDLEAEVFRCYSGEAAMELLLKLKMDLVITDIQMPVVSGLDLMRRVKKLWSSCRMIFLTGYSSFDYAYEALRYADVDYILKNEGYERLLETVRRAAEANRREQEEMKRRAYLEAQVQKAISILHKDLCLQMMEGATPSAETLRAANTGLDPSSPLFSMLATREGGETETHSAGNLFVSTLKTYLQGREIHWIYGVMQGRIVCFFQPKAVDDAAYSSCRALIWEILCEVQEAVEQKLNSSFCIIFSGDARRVGQLPAVFREITALIARSSSLRNGAIFKLHENTGEIRVENAISYIQQYIHDHFPSDISVAELADLVHFNASYLSRIFKEATGSSLTDYVNRVRIQAACKLLSETHLKASEVAASTGFGTPKYFNTVFKRYMGAAPQEWRKGHYAKYG